MIAASSATHPRRPDHFANGAWRAKHGRRIAAILGLWSVGAGLNAVEIRWQMSSDSPSVEVHGLSSQELEKLAKKPMAEASLKVFTEPMAAGPDAAKVSLPAVAGTWRVEEGRLRFMPRFPFVAGVRYRAEYRGGKDEAPLIAHFEVPVRKRTRATEVVQVYPSGDQLPENQLKFYVQFSAPMSRGGTYEHVHVRDAGGREVDLPFLDLDEELWDPSMTRLTLLIDPGRIKRGVKPLEDIGPVFEEGKTYSLTLDANCRDADGQPLREKFEKAFRIGAADRTPPDPQRWKITPPRKGTRDPLRVAFDEPLDQALALRLISVARRQEAVAIEGEPKLASAETEWSFVPSQPWPRGDFQLNVVTTIEDLAGNNIGKTFDVDLAAGAQRRLAAEKVSVGFEIR